MNAKNILLLVSILSVPLIVLHYYFKHRFDKNKSLMEKWFQWEDINNHETVVIGIIGFIAGIIVCFYIL